MLKGKGYFIWQIEKCAPDAATLVRRAQQADIRHVLIKVADGDKIYPFSERDPGGKNEALTQESIAALKAAGIIVWGWSFIYGTTPDPASQARRFVQRLQYFGLEGAVINAEKLNNNLWTPQNAAIFMETLVKGLGNIGQSAPQLALSSYRFMKFHPDFPFDVFMEYCQIAMPQVYWVAKNGGDPIRNLQDSYDEYSTRYPGKVFLPTGAAYGEEQVIGNERFYWEARPDQITAFLNQAEAMGFEAVNFWSWQSAWERRALWDAVAAHPFKRPLQPISQTLTTAAATPPSTHRQQVAAVGLPDTTDDDGVAIIEVGAPGYQQGLYGNTTAELVAFTRANRQFTWVRGERERSSAYAQWFPRITKSGEYLIEAFIPGENATTRRARYHITGVVGAEATTVVEVNQLNAVDEWVRLGFFQLDGNQQFSGMVALNNLVGTEANNNTKVVFGPIRWTRVERTGILEGFADGFDSPVGTEEERNQPNEAWGARKTDWNGAWVDANPYLNHYFLGYHTGVDLNLPRDEDKGAPCYSIADGVVTFAGPARNRDGSFNGFGNLVVIRHLPYITPEGKQIVAHSRYGHIKDIVVEVGQTVRRGDRIATIWNVGTRAHHLHFDISTTGILESSPMHWPGERKAEVEKHYVDPYVFIRAYRPRN